MDNELLAKLLDDRDDLTAEEWQRLCAELREHPELADELHGLLLTDELLSQKLSPDRREFPSAVRMRLETDGREGIRLEDVKALDRRHHEESLRRFWRTRWMAAAAAAVLVTAGLAALWFYREPEDPLLARRQERHRQVLIEQLQELNLERKAIIIPEAPQEPGKQTEGTQVDVVFAQREAEEAARFVEARRRFMMRQLRTFGQNRRIPDDLDVDESVARPGESAAATTSPDEVGRVLSTEGQHAGLLIREAKEGPTRQELTEGLTLIRGDQIQTLQGQGPSCASIRLDGGATIDLGQQTSIEVYERDSLRLNAGRIYAHIAVPAPDEEYPETEPPFSLQTDAGRFLTHRLDGEFSLTSGEIFKKKLTARVEAGRVHLVNGKGHVMGRRGEELQAQADMPPGRREGFTETVWRGNERNLPELPYGLGSPLVFSTYTPVQHTGTHYTMALALRGEIRLLGLQTALGTLGETPEQIRGYFRELTEETRKLQPLAPGRLPPATLGAMLPLQVPAGALPERTRPERSDAALQILAAVRSATPERPLLILCHGAMTDVACAWLMDPTIAGRVVVGGEMHRNTDAWSAWNSDPWAGEIVLRRFRFVLLYHDGFTADRALLERVKNPRWSSLRDNKTSTDHKFSLVYHLTSPDARMSVRRIRLAGVKNDKPVFEADPKGTIWEVTSRVKPDVLLTEFERIFLTPQRQ